jgi:hypothetical protein
MCFRSVELDLFDRRPVALMPRPALRADPLGVGVDPVGVRQDRDVFSTVRWPGGDEEDRAVAVFLVGPLDEAGDPGAGIRDTGEGLIRIPPGVLHSTEQTFRVGVVVARRGGLNDGMMPRR